jgi:Ni,Fe-hydrogenase III large subunit
MTSTRNILRQSLLAESIAGDSAVAHAMTYARLREKLAGELLSATTPLDILQTLALEMERIAMHIADTGALCTDVGYQLGQAACEALRTVTINTTQAWCGNRFGKGIVRPYGSDYPLTEAKIELIRKNMEDVRRRYNEVRNDIKTSPSLLSRYEQCGVVALDEMTHIGGVGPAARASGLKRDLRTTHPFGAYIGMLQHEPIIKHQGDIMARLMMRCREVLQSIAYVMTLLDNYDPSQALSTPDYTDHAHADTLAFGLTEGWRGEICHVAITDSQGAIECYKVKDPSLHNWLALALAVRGEGISDFPICNKSFNLSYCGHDL